MCPCMRQELGEMVKCTLPTSCVLFHAQALPSSVHTTTACPLPMSMSPSMPTRPQIRALALPCPSTVTRSAFAAQPPSILPNTSQRLPLVVGHRVRPQPTPDASHTPFAPVVLESSKRGTHPGRLRKSSRLCRIRPTDIVCTYWKRHTTAP